MDEASTITILIDYGWTNEQIEEYFKQIIK